MATKVATKVATKPPSKTAAKAKTATFDDAQLGHQEAQAAGDVNEAEANGQQRDEAGHAEADARKRLHDAWVARQIDERGWAWGPLFSADQRTDPRLVHFDQLSEQQRADLERDCWTD